MSNLFKVNILEGSLVKNLLLFALPLMFSSILQLLFNAADIIVVGRYAGDASMAAVSSCGALINLIVNLFVGLSIGANVLIARNLGAREYEKTNLAVNSAVSLSLAGGVVLTVFGYFMAPQLLIMMDCPPDVLPLATVYLKCYFLGMPGLMLYNYGAAALRASGDTQRPLVFLTIAGIVNFLMNLFFVIVLKLDAAGVGLATSISQYISGCLVLLSLMKEESALNVDLSNLKIDKDCLVEMARIGLPAGFQGMLFSISNVVIQSSVNSFGSIIMAGNGAAANIEGFVYVSMNSFHQSCLTFVSQNIGASQKARVKKIMLTSLMLVSIVGLLLGIGGYTFGDTLLRIYSKDEAVIAAGLQRLSWVCRPYFICGIMDVLVGGLRGMGLSLMPTIVSLIGVCGLRLLWIATIFVKYRSLEILLISYPVSWIVTSLFHALFFVIAYQKLLKEDKHVA